MRVPLGGWFTGSITVPRYKSIREAVSVFGAVATVISFALVPFGFGAPFETADGFNPVKVLQAVIVACWAVVPPLWFWFDYFFLYQRLDPPEGTEPFDRYKFGQEVSAKIWIALTSALFLLYFHKDLK